MFRTGIAEAHRVLDQAAVTYHRALERPDCDVGMYRPLRTDDQTPHARDEFYIVATGSGEFIYDGQTQRIAAGDVLFAERGVAHRFANFSDDFSTWVVFIGARP